MSHCDRVATLAILERLVVLSHLLDNVVLAAHSRRHKLVLATLPALLPRDSLAHFIGLSSGIDGILPGSHSRLALIEERGLSIFLLRGGSLIVGTDLRIVVKYLIHIRPLWSKDHILGIHLLLQVDFLTATVFVAIIAIGMGSHRSHAILGGKEDIMLAMRIPVLVWYEVGVSCVNAWLVSTSMGILFELGLLRRGDQRISQLRHFNVAWSDVISVALILIHINSGTLPLAMSWIGRSRISSYLSDGLVHRF